MWKKVWPLLEKGLDVNVAVGFTDTLAKDIPDVRKGINNNYQKDYVEMCHKVANADNERKLGKINFLFKTQVEGEVGNFIDDLEE